MLSRISSGRSKKRLWDWVIGCGTGFALDDCRRCCRAARRAPKNVLIVDSEEPRCETVEMELLKGNKFSSFFW